MSIIFRLSLAEINSLTADSCPSPNSNIRYPPGSSRSAEPETRRRIMSRPSAPAKSAISGSMVAHFRLQGSAGAAQARRAGWPRSDRTRPSSGVQQVALHAFNAIGRPRGAPCSAARSPAPRPRASVATTRAWRRSTAMATATQPLPVQTSATHAAAPRDPGTARVTASTRPSVSGRGIRTAGDTSNVRFQNSRVPVMYAQRLPMRPARNQFVVLGGECRRFELVA